MISIENSAWAGKSHIKYEVSFENPENSSLISDLRQVSSTVRNKDNPPLTKGLLMRRAQSDLPKMTDVLRAQGYFDAQIKVNMKDHAPDGPVQIVFIVRPGPVYTIRNVHIRPHNSELLTANILPSQEELGLSQGDPAVADAIRSGRSILLSKLNEQGYILADAGSPTVHLNTENAYADVIYPLDSGPKATFGPVTIHGLERVREDFVRSQIPWSQGDTYDPQQVRTLQNRLIQTELFNMVQMKHPDQVNDQGQLPLTMEVSEVDHKKISFRLGYETDTGIQGSAAWEHKNLLGRGQRLLLEMEASQIRQELLSRYTQKNIWEREFDLVVQGSAFREDIDAYTSTGGKASVHIENQIFTHLRLGGGLGYKASRIKDSDEDQTFHQFSIPTFAAWDSRNNPLNPSQGSMHNLYLTPMLGLFGEEFSLLKSSLSTHWYFDLLPDKGQAILALRGKVGIINASSTSEVPADERWYAGGGGSIRGYPYQEVGPYQDGDPYGGRSLLETSAELRWKWSDTIGTVAFVDAGNAYDDVLPDPAEKLYWGAGMGMRYYTGIGPLRLDVAFPLTSDDHIDDNYQVYISLGQAF